MTYDMMPRPQMWTPLLNAKGLLGGSGGLLDGAAPELPGVLASPIASPPQSHGIFSRIGSALSTVFAGADNPGLSPEQNAQARKAALIQSGLATIAASGPAAVKPGIMQVLAAGALAGQQAGGNARANAYGASAMQGMQKIVDDAGGKIDLATLNKMYAHAVAVGDDRAATSLATVIQSAQSAAAKGTGQITEIVGADGKPRRVQVGADGSVKDLGEVPKPLTNAAPTHITMKDPKTGKATVYSYENGQYTAIGEAPTQPTPPHERWQVASGQDANGKPVMGRINLDTGAFEPISGIAPKPAAGQDAGKEAMAMAQLPIANATLQKYESQLTFRSAYMTSKGLLGNYFNTEAGQAIKTAGAAFVDSVFAMRKIGRPSTFLVQQYLHTFVPEAGDMPATLRLKAQFRQAALGGKLPPKLETLTQKEAQGPGGSDPFADLGSKGKGK